MNNNRNLKEAEVSPDGRYVRFDAKLGNGAYKEVFLAYDTETGKEVAWNTVTLARLPPTEKKRIRMETEILKELDHPHIINFYHVWENPERDQICFTTEIVTSGTLKQYVHRVRNVKLKVIKKWCRQILTALDYLHIHSPPIIHRDLKCDNIFINGNSATIRIGDFGLSAARHTTHVESVLGTPEFMAPELYDENYDEKVDLWSFGMCVLEMTTKEYPYEECSNAAQIWKKVSMGQKPEVLNRIKNQEVRAFIDVCLMPAQERLSARELLKHPFLKFKRSDPARDNITVQVEPRSSPNNRQGKEEQREQLQQGIEARLNKEQMERQLYNSSQIGSSTQQYQAAAAAAASAAGGGRHPNNNSLESPDALVSPQSLNNRVPQPTPSPPIHGGHHHAHPPPHINTNTPTPTHHQQQQSHTQQHQHQQQHPQSLQHSQPHPLSDVHHQQHGVHPHEHPHLTQQREHTQQQVDQYSQPNSAQTPPARFSRQASLPNMVPVTGGGLTHSQSTNAVAALHHPHPQRHHLATPHSAQPNVSPDLIHVSSVVVEVESVHSHFADIALHIHFEAGTRRKKQIRFEFDFYRDTSESIASEMVRALKLPDQERTARLIATNMEMKIDPYRLEYYQHHGSSSANTPPLTGGSSSSQQQHDSPSPSTSPASRTKSLPKPGTAGASSLPSGVHHDDRPHVHPPPHPPPSATHAKGGPTGTIQTPTAAGGTTGGGGGHYATLPSPSAHHPPAGKTTTHHHGTMPQPKLSSAQPTNVTAPGRPTMAGAAKPPHPLTPHGQPVVVGGGGGRPGTGTGAALSPVQQHAGTGGTSQQYSEGMQQQQQKSMGNRRHSHDPAVHAQSQTQSQSHTTAHPDPLAQTTMRTASIPLQSHSPHTAGSNLSPGTGSSSGGGPSSGGGLRRSSSTSSLAFMLTPEEAATKQHHDKLYDEYRLLSISSLKERIKERMKAKNASKETGSEGEAVELNGILEKNDLIESLIRLTPRMKPESLQDRHHSIYPQSHQVLHGHHSPPSPRERMSDRERFEIHDQSQPPSDSSAASTPRIHQHGGEYSAASTPSERSRTHSIDAGNELFAATVKNLRLAEAQHHSPGTSPGQSPLPSPATRSMQDRQRFDSTGSSDDVSHHTPAPSSHRLSQEPYRREGGNHNNVGVGAPSPLTRSTSSPYDLPEIGRQGRKGLVRPESSGAISSHVHPHAVGSQSHTQHHTSALDSAPAAQGRNFTFPSAAGGGQQPGSGHTSPASTSSQQSHTSIGGGAAGHIDLEELSNTYTNTAAFPSVLHVDVNPLSPAPSAPTSAEMTTSPVTRSFAHVAGGGANNNLHPPHATLHSLAPQSPTIPEETGNEADESGLGSSAGGAAFAESQLRKDVPPVAHKSASMPVVSGARHNSVLLPGQIPAGGKPLSTATGGPHTTSHQQQQQSHIHPSHSNDTINPPLGAKKQQYSASVDDLSRLTATGSASSTTAIKGSLTPSGSPNSVGPHQYPIGGSMSGSLAHLHLRDSPSSTTSHSASSTPASALRQGPPSHQRANSVLVTSMSHGSLHELDGPESEEKKKSRLETAEKARLQKKNDAAKAAKMCEDKILSGLGNFSFH